MILLEDKIEIQASPEQIFNWLAHEENYLAWHPQDHIEWRTLKGDLMEEGSAFYFAEYIGGRTLRMKCRISEVEPKRRVEWAAMGPFSLVGVGGAFIVEPTDVGSLFTAVVYLGWRVPYLASLRLGGSDVPSPPARSHQAAHGGGGAKPEATFGGGQ